METEAYDYTVHISGCR